MPRSKKRKYLEVIEDDPKLTVLKPVVLLEALAESIAIGERIQGSNQGKAQGQGHGDKGPVTPIKLTKFSDVQDKVKRLEMIINVSDRDNEVLKEKVLFLEDELCKKNAIIKELEEKLMTMDDKQSDPSRDDTKEANTTSEENETSKDDGENLDDSIEFLLQCKAIAKRGAEGLLKVKLEPAEGGNQGFGEYQNSKERQFR